MQRCGIAVAIMVTALLSGCFQEGAPRHDAPVAVTASSANPQIGVERTIGMDEEETASVPELAATLSDSADPNVRREAIYTIADVGESEDAAIIGQALYDSDSEIRSAAIEALTGIEGGISADWLSVALGDPDPRIRRTAVEALGEIGGDTSRFLLQQALADADQGVREAAQQMLEEPALARREFR
ncbi:MAG: HEAT repeat domain-containing protein [Steroidobacteraceae bacterium]